MRFSTTTEVDASPAIVFAVLCEFERWPEWTPTVTRAQRLDDGHEPLTVGSRVRIEQPKLPPAEWTVTALEQDRGFRFESRSPGVGVVADHWAEAPASGRGSLVTLSVTFTGVLGRTVGWLMRSLNRRYLAQEAAGLRDRCEERARRA